MVIGEISNEKKIFISLLLLVSCFLFSGLMPDISVEFSLKNAYLEILESGDTEWDYLIFGECITIQCGEVIKEKIQEDLSIEINFHNCSKPGYHSTVLKNKLKNDAEVRDLIKNAEIIIFEVPWNCVQDCCSNYLNYTNKCGGEDNEDCLRDAFGAYMSDAEEIILEIVSLKSPSEALIRIFDTYQFNVEYTKEKNKFDVINKYWKQANDHVIEFAASLNIPSAGVYYALMGENNNRNPTELGLLYDQFHLTERGINLIVNLITGIGYHYAPEK